MVTYPELAANLGDQMVAAIKRTQEFTVPAISSWTKAVGALVPEVPGVPAGTIWPAPQEVVQTTFTLVEKLLEAQKAYVLGLVDAFQPITEKVTDKTETVKPPKVKTES